MNRSDSKRGPVTVARWLKVPVSERKDVMVLCRGWYPTQWASWVSDEVEILEIMADSPGDLEFGHVIEIRKHHDIDTGGWTYEMHAWRDGRTRLVEIRRLAEALVIPD